MPRTIAVIGAGFGGLGVARWLEPRAENADLAIILIDKRPFHEFPALFYEVATGSVEGRPEDCEKILASGVCVNLNAYDRLLLARAVTFRCDEVVAIDRLTRRLQLRGGEEIPYDALVLALGAETATYGIPGLREHAIPLKTVRDALRIRRRILDVIDRARRGTGTKVAIVIGGGGATGVEFACELANALRVRTEHGEICAEDYEIALVERDPRLLASFPKQLSRIALRRLHTFGVRVLLDTVVERVELGRVTVTSRPLQSDERREQLLCGFTGASCTLSADLMVWTGGIQFPSILRNSGFPCDGKGRAIVGDDLLIRGETCVFAVGDCAAFTDPRTRALLPPLASVAVRETPIAGANALACLDAYPLRRFRPRALPAIVPFGGKVAGIAYRRWVWIGRGPWLLRSLVDLQYFCSILGLALGIRMWWRGARVYVRND